MSSRRRVDMPELMELIDQTRFQRGMTWGQLADELAFERPYMSKLVNGVVDNPSADRLLSLLYWLKLTDVELGRLVQRITVTEE